MNDTDLVRMERRVAAVIGVGAVLLLVWAGSVIFDSVAEFRGEPVVPAILWRVASLLFAAVPLWFFVTIWRFLRAAIREEEQS